MFYITHVEPRHPTKGKGALFFLREYDDVMKNGRTHTRVQEVPHYFATSFLQSTEAGDLLAAVNLNPALTELEFQCKTWGKRCIVAAAGSKEHRLVLPSPFIRKNEKGRGDPLGLNSSSRQLRWLYPPGMVIKDPDRIPLPAEIESRTFVPLEQLLLDSYAVLDIEVEGWEQGKDHIFMAVYMTPQRRVLFHDLPFEETEQEGFSLVQFQSQEHLGSLLTEYIHQDDPLWVYGHNIMNYDQLKLRDLTENYFPAANEHYPITKTTQGLGRVLTKGRWTLDSYGYHFNHRNILADNKISTITGMKKLITYEEQAELVVKARVGDTEAATKLIQYCLEDGLETERLGNHLRSIVAQKMLHFHRDVDSICASSKLTIADEWWSRRHFFVTGTYRDAWKRRRQEELFSIEQFKQEVLRPSCKPGFFDDVEVVYFTPFLAGCKDILQQEHSSLWNHVQHCSDPLERFDVMQTLHAQQAYLIQEMESILHQEHTLWTDPLPPLSDQQHRALYSLFSRLGIEDISPRGVLEQICKSINVTNTALRTHQDINQGPLLSLLRERVDAQRMTRLGYGCSLGRGPALSLRKGVFVANPFQEQDEKRFIYQGLSLRKGTKTNFERRLLTQVVHDIFQGSSFITIASHLRQEIAAFGRGELPPEEYYLPIKRRTYYRNLLEEAMVKSEVGDEIIGDYRRLKDRIGFRYSDDTQAELAALLERCSSSYGYKFMRDIVEQIEHPFPPEINLVYASGLEGKPIPVEWVENPDYDAYKIKAEEHFAYFFPILARSVQRELVLG